MSEMVQMNTRINRNLKAAGDSVFRKFGYTPSSAIQAVWEYVSENKALPDFMPIKMADKVKAKRRQEIQDGAGLVPKLYFDLTGTKLDLDDLDEVSYDDIRVQGWKERGAFDD